MNKIKEARKKAGLSQVKMGNLFGIPRRTIEDWEMGKSTAPEYVQRFLIKELKRFAAGDIIMTKDDYNNEYIAEKMWALEEYRDSAGVGSVTFFYSKNDAMKHANEKWSDLSESDKRSYEKDACGFFRVSLLWARFEDGEYIQAGDEYNDLNDPIEIGFDFLQGI